MLGSIALTFGSVVLSLVALELVLRIVGVSIGTVQINRATVRRSANPRLAFDLRPGAVVKAEVEYRVSYAGLRNPELSLEKPAGVRRIAVLGDSIAFGYWVEEEQAFPRQLERMLDAGVQVLNFGVPGYNLEQEIETLRVRALAYSPDLVVVAFCLNDLQSIFSREYGLVEDRSARASQLGGRLFDWLMQRSVLGAWLEYRLTEMEARRRFARGRSGALATPRGKEAAAQRQLLASRFAAVRELLAPRGIQGLVVVFPVFDNRFSNYAQRDLHGAVAQAAQDAGLLSLDLLDCYAAYDPRDVRIDAIHPSPLGHRVAAHATRDALCAQGLLCDSAPVPAIPCTGYKSDEFPTLRGY